jgi:4-methylaminobutanoate oxidase (formaldehyde-forming)
MSYVGELGYELYINNVDAKKIYNLIINAGKEFKLSHCGAHTMDIMRMESGFLHWGHDISPEENQYQANLNFAISFKKKFNFIGREKLLKIKNDKLKKRIIMLVLKDNKPGNPLLLNEEPIYLNDQIIGKTTSGNYSFNYNKNLSFGYIETNLSNDDLLKKDLYIEVEKIKYLAELLTEPLKQSHFKTI